MPRTDPPCISALRSGMYSLMFTTSVSPRRSVRRTALFAFAAIAASLIPAAAHAAPVTPSTPSNIAVISARYRFITVWDAVAGATGYKVTATQGANTYTCTTENTRCIITGLPQQQLTYNITVTASNPQGTSSPSDAVVRPSWYHPEAPSTLDLSGRNLSGLDLSTANLTGVNFTNANLSGSNLTGAYFRDVNIQGANLANTVLNDIITRGITGTPATARAGYQQIGGFLIGPRVNLWGQNLAGLNLAGANLWRAQLSGADFTGANLTNANLAGTLLMNTNFSNATLSRVNISTSIANGANFTNTSLTTANLTGIRAVGIVGTPTLATAVRNANQNLVSKGFSLYQANLTGANLSGMDLTGTNFVSANLTNANLASTNLTNADFAQSTLTGASGAAISGAPKNLPLSHRINAGTLQAR
jgi:uncharacterized protein YjbI with pentapeptide repeats